MYLPVLVCDEVTGSVAMKTAPKAKPPAMIGFILQNAGSDRKLYEFAVSVDTVESVTGLSFFTAVDGNLRRRLASGYDIDAWKWTPNRQ